MKQPEHRGRRGFLKRTGLVVAGVIGGVFATRGESAYAAFARPPEKDSRATWELYGRHWHLGSPGSARRGLPAMGDQTLGYGELVKWNGAKVGEFYSSCLNVRSPFGPSLLSPGAVEIHTFNLVDGTLLGMGTSSGTTGEESLFAVVGGTGRFASVKGSYTARQRPQELGGDGTAEFRFDLTGGGPVHMGLIHIKES